MLVFDRIDFFHYSVRAVSKDMVTSQEASKLFEVKLDACETQEFSIVDEDEPST